MQARGHSNKQSKPVRRDKPPGKCPRCGSLYRHITTAVGWMLIYKLMVCALGIDALAMACSVWQALGPPCISHARTCFLDHKVERDVADVIERDPCLSSLIIMYYAFLLLYFTV